MEDFYVKLLYNIRLTIQSNLKHWHHWRTNLLGTYYARSCLIRFHSRSPKAPSLSHRHCGEGVSSRSRKKSPLTPPRPRAPRLGHSACVWDPTVCRRFFSPDSGYPHGGSRRLLFGLRALESLNKRKIAVLFSFRYKSDDYSDLNIIQLSTSVRFISF